jgi:hypothetical protein
MGQSPERSEEEKAILAEGQWLEPFVVSQYERATDGFRVWRPENGGVLQVVGPEPWVVVSPDGIVETGGDAGVFEGKTDRDPHRWMEERQVIERWTPECAAILPAEYATQAILLMYATELPWCDLAALVPAPWGFPRLRYHRLMRDLETEREMVDTLGQWREKHIIRGEAPDLDGSAECKRFINARSPAPKDGRKPMRDATEMEKALVHDWIYAKRRKDEAEIEVDELSNQLMALVGDEYGLRLGFDGKLICYGNPGRRVADMKLLEERYPEIYRDVVRQGEGYRVLRHYPK